MRCSSSRTTPYGTELASNALRARDCPSDVAGGVVAERGRFGSTTPTRGNESVSRERRDRPRLPRAAGRIA